MITGTITTEMTGLVQVKGTTEGIPKVEIALEYTTSSQQTASGKTDATGAFKISLPSLPYGSIPFTLTLTV